MSGLIKDSSGITYQEYEGTGHTLIGAGSETTATTLTALVFFLLSNPEKMRKLQHEVRSKVKKADDININTVNRMPYLLACITETLRVNPPIADGFPRSTGSNFEPVCGRVLPPKVSFTRLQED